MCIDVNMAMINAAIQVNSNKMLNWNNLPNTNIFSVEFLHAGQNIYIYHDSDEYPDAEKVIRDAFKAWNDEYKMSNMKIINAGKPLKLLKKYHEKTNFYFFIFIIFVFQQRCWTFYSKCSRSSTEYRLCTRSIRERRWIWQLFRVWLQWNKYGGSLWCRSVWCRLQKWPPRKISSTLQKKRKIRIYRIDCNESSSGKSTCESRCSKALDCIPDFMDWNDFACIKFYWHFGLNYSFANYFSMFLCF